MKRNFFNSEGATIWNVIDIEGKDIKTKECVIVEKTSKGKIIKDLQNQYVIAEFEGGNTIKINKRYVLINLPDVLQKEVVYSITNATSSIYNINGNSIPGVTGEVLYKGYTDKVPLMYRTAEKLYRAENNFLSMGLTIKIYDAYRPYPVTKDIYAKMLEVTDTYKEFLNKTVNGVKYDQTDFLAAHASSHNYGVALDMTLAKLEDNKELKMQTEMHNLSVFSIVDYNNDSANLLARVMKKNKFVPLSSEWWHFQDNSSKVSVMDFYA